MEYLQPVQWNADDSIETDALQLPTGQYIVDSGGQPWSFFSPDNNVLRFEVQPGDHWANDPAGSERDEIAGTTQYANGTPIDVSYSFMVEPGAANTAAWCVVGQLHQVDYTGEVPYSPPVAIMMVGEKMAVSVNYTDSAGVEHAKYIYVSPTNIVRGQYYDMNISANFNPTGGGQVAVTCDGQLLASYTGPLGILGHTGVFWKEGIYEANSTETMAVDYKNLNISTGSGILSASSTPALPGSASSVSCSYTANNIMNVKTVTNLDLSQDVYNFSTTGAYYLTSHLHYDATGALTQVVDYSANAIRSYAWTSNADGSTSVLNYDAAGNLTRSIWNYANGMISTQTYVNNAVTEKFVQYTNGGSTEIDYSATGTVAKLVQIYPDGSMTSQVYGITGQNYVAQTTQYNTSGQITSLTRANAAGVTVFRETIGASATTYSTWNASGSLASVVTDFASGTVLSQTYTNGVLSDSFTKNPDGSSLDINYNAGGAVTKQVQINADGSKLVETYGITGQVYVSEVDTYAASGALTSLVRDNASGQTVFSQVTNSAGTTTVDQFTATGVLTQSVGTASTGVVTKEWYASNGNLTAAQILQPGGSSVYDTYNAQGALAKEVSTIPNVSLTAYTFNGATNPDGSAQYVKSVTAYQSGLSFASDGINDTFNSFGGDTFAFNSGFGAAVINNFHAAAGVNQDLIQLSQATVPGFAELAVRQSGTDTLLTLSSGDSIRLTGVSATAFTAANVKFT